MSGCAACERKTSSHLVCNICKRQLDIRHPKTKDPIQHAIDTNRHCSKCDNQDWSIKE